MKNLLLFVLGVLLGAFSYMTIKGAIDKHAEEQELVDELIYDDGVLQRASCQNIQIFDAPGEELKSDSFKVFKQMPGGAALALSSAGEGEEHQFDEPVVYIPHNEGVVYQKDQIVFGPARQIGTYRYIAKDGFIAIIPVIGVKGYDFYENNQPCELDLLQSDSGQQDQE